ncbi:MAG: Ppx/GppA phosphatase family protein [Eubacterium sp.]|nr:Ppx/GppA phosphatase family protein [Eubacterium sp.]
MVNIGNNKSIGVIDIGSNSVHLVIGEYRNNEYFRIVDDVKVNVRLSQGMAETGSLSQERMDYGEETLRMYKNMLDTYQVDKVMAVATAAVRKADNGQAFVDRIRETTGIDIDIIPGTTEAAMDYLGVVNTIDIADGVMMDIGGGSVEFVLIKNRRMAGAISLPFGSIDLTERFGLRDRVKAGNIAALEEFLEDSLSEVKFFKEARGLPVVGVGGTIRNVGRIHRRLVDYPLEIAHNYRMDYAAVAKVCDMAAAMDLEERRGLKGLSKGRSDIFVGASQALKKVMEILGSGELIISDAGLRDGLIFKYFGDDESNLVGNVFDNSLVNTMLNYDVNIPHAYHVYGLAQKLFSQLAPLHKIEDDVYHIVKASAMLHDVGIKIQYSNHHEHSFYLILNAGLQGISQKALLMSAFVALNHRTNKKVKVDAEYGTLLTDKDRARIETLSLFLQIAEYLDRSMDGIVKDVSCTILEDSVEILVLSSTHSVFADMIIAECGKKFKRVFGKNLKIKNKVIGGA